MRFRFLALVSTVALLVTSTVNASAALKMERIPSVFAELTSAKSLANPSMVLMNLNTGETVYSRDPKSLRKPASTLKLMSAFAALEFLPADRKFITEIYKTDIENTFQIVSDFDPSITPSHKLYKNLKFVWSENLVNQIRSEAKSKSLKIRYYGLTYRTKTNMDQSFRRAGYRITWKNLAATESLTHATEQIYRASSPELAKILNYTLLFSDNWVADYVAKSAAAAAGYGYSPVGISMVFSDVLARYNIEFSNLHAVDGSGLSHENRMTTETLVRVLSVMQSNAKFASAIEGLPVSGVSGTLQNRYIKSAPQAVGLIQAKTGSLNGVVSLAGFIDSGENRFVFAVIADRIGIGYYSENSARAAIDKLLSKLAEPLKLPDLAASTPSPTPEAPSS